MALPDYLPIGTKSIGVLTVGTINESSTATSSQVSVKSFGAKGDGTTNDTVAIQAALTAAAASQRSLFIPKGTYLCTANLTVPILTAQLNFRIYGEGMGWQSIIKFSGAAVTTGLTFVGPTSTYVKFGSLHDIMIEGTAGAVTGLTYNWTSFTRVERVKVQGFTQNGINIENSNAPTVDGCYVAVCGDSTHTQVRFNLCTTVGFRSNYITTGNSGVLGGLSIDRTVVAVAQQNAIESTGINVLVSCETVVSGDILAASDIEILNNDLEAANSAAAPTIIKIGYGLVTINQFISSVAVYGNSGYTSSNTAGAIGCDVVQVQNFEAGRNYFAMSSLAAASYNFGANTSVQHARVSAQRGQVGYAIPWVKMNGSQVIEATPFGDWDSLDPTIGNYPSRLISTAPTATIANKIGVQGGIYKFMALGNAGGALTINATAEIPLLTGYPLTIIPTDGNITLKHNNGVKGFFLKGGVDLLLSLTVPVTFIYYSSTGKWHQL